MITLQAFLALTIWGFILGTIFGVGCMMYHYKKPIKTNTKKNNLIKN